jgi:hypothetical protein
MYSIAYEIQAKVLKPEILFFPTDFAVFLDQKVGNCWENFGKFC